MYRHPSLDRPPLFDAELLDLVAQGAKGHPQEPRGGGLVVACLLQRSEYGIALDVLELI